MWMCTECGSKSKSEAKASKCHWMVGGVIPCEPGDTLETAEARVFG